MKKIRSIIATCGIQILFAHAAFAQVYLNESFIVEKGLKGGLNLATFTIPTEGDEKNFRVGYIFGGYITLRITRQFLIQPEILYSMKGVKERFSDSNLPGCSGESETVYKLSYVEIPLLIRNSGTLGDRTYGLMLGPAFGFNINKKRVDNCLSSGNSVEIEDQEVRDNEFSFVLGGQLKSGITIAELRYTIGLTPAVDTASKGRRNTVISFMFGLAF